MDAIVMKNTLESYINGYTLVKERHKVPLKDGCNKYNIKFIKELGELRYAFQVLIVTDRVVIKLLEMNANHKNGDTGNIWNIIKGNAGTLSFLETFKNALKKYAIDRQSTIDAFEIYFQKQWERVNRSKLILSNLLEDYGLTKLMNVVETHSGKNLFDDLKSFVAERDDYDIIVEEYTEYLVKLANENNLSLDNNISESLKTHREFVHNKAQSRKIEKEQKKLESKEARLIRLLKNDSANIQHDIFASYYDRMMKLSRNQASIIFSRVNKLGGSVWYISLTRGSSVVYMQIDKSTTRLPEKAVLFLTEKDAEVFLTNVMKESTYISSYRTHIARLITNNDTSNGLSPVLFKDSNGVALIDGDYLGDKLGVNEAAFVKEAILKTNGHLTNKPVIDLYIYMVLPKSKGFENKEAIKFIGMDDDKPIIVESLTEAFTFKIDDMSEARLNQIKLLYSDMDISEYNIKFSSKWYEDKIKDLNNVNRDLRNALKYRYPRKPEFNCSEDLLNRLRERLNDMASQGIPMAYYLVEKKRTDVTFYKSDCKLGRTKSIALMTLFNNKQDAYNTYISEYNPKGTSVIRIMGIPLN